MEEENRALEPGRRRSCRYPLLAYHHGIRRRHQTFCGISSSGPVFSESQSIPELLNKTILYSSPDGDWLLLLDQDPPEDREKESRRRQLSLWSPTRDESIDLPGVDFDCVKEGLFSSSPLHPTCLILLLVQNSPLILCCRVGDETWSKFDYAKTIESQLRARIPSISLENSGNCLVHPVVFHDRIYACTASNHYADLVEIIIDDHDLNDCKTLLLSIVPILRSSGAGKFTSFLVPHGGDLYLTLISDECLDFEHRLGWPEVYRFDFSRMGWKAVTSLKDGGAIFLGNSYSISCHGNPMKKQWSYIYFICKSSPRLYIYRVEDERITSYLPFDHLPQSSQSVLCNWIIVPEPAMDIHEHEQKKNNSVAKCSGDHIKNSMAGLAEYLSRNSNAKKNKTTVLSSSSSSSLCDLPREVLAVIAGNLSSLVDYIHFRCVNKVCASATIGMRMKMKNPFQPCLIYKDRGNGVYNIIDSDLNHKLSFKIPNGLDDHKICCSRDGWLLLEKPTSCHFNFLNPLTSQVIPRRGEYSNAVSNLTFSGKPDSPDSFVLTMSNKGSAKGLDNRKTGWKTFAIGSEYQWAFEGGGYSSPVWLGESCYYLGSHGHLLGRFQLAKDGEGFQWEVTRITLPYFQSTRIFFTECGGELVCIFLGDEEGSRIRVHKMKHEEWEEIDSLGGYSLYLSSVSCISYLAQRPEMANRIYVPKFYKDGLVYYSLDTKTYHSVGNEDEELHNFCAISMYPNGAWIQPNWS